ncbi:MAG: alpha/beta fold hydrolase [Gammaproteobacteria bacterium]
MQSQTLDDRLTTVVTLDVERDSENVRLLHLDGGRRLAYTEYGDRNGYPLFHCHSHGSSRLEAASFHKAALAGGFRIIAIDRPGVGLSDYCAYSSVEGFATVLLSLADKLRCKHFGLLANGGGASYALALAALEPKRVGIVLGLSCQFPHQSRTGTLLRKSAGIALKLSIYFRHFVASHTPSRYLQHILDNLSFADKRLFENPKLLAMVERDMKESLRQGVKGLAQDSALQLKVPPLPFDRLQMPCHFWQGSSDCRRALHVAQRFVSLCPDAKLHELANRGRFFYLRNVDDVFANANIALGRTQSSVPANAVAIAKPSAQKAFISQAKTANR